MEWTRMLEPDRRPVSAPAAPVLPGARPGSREIQIDVRARDEYLSFRQQLAREESVAEEMALPGLPVEEVNPARVAAVELSHALRESTVGQPQDEVVVVVHQRPRECVPVVLPRDSQVHREESLVLTVVREEGTAVATARAHVVVALGVDRRPGRHPTNVVRSAQQCIVCGSIVTVL